MNNSELLQMKTETPRHSTLELTKHDPTAGAPERDNAVVAPEHNWELDAPQVKTLASVSHIQLTNAGYCSC